jgi:sirohydrochlorin ferrochelatase
VSAALVVVAHGSRDPRAKATVLGLANLVRAMRSDVDVRAAFLELSTPGLPDALTEVHAAGHRAAVVVPLLLGNAYHAKVDVPNMVADTMRGLPGLQVSVANVLGPDQRLEWTALRRLAQAGVRAGDPELGVVLAAAGSSDRAANQAVHAVASKWTVHYGWAGVRTAFASGEPSLPDAVARLRAVGARRFAVASWFLAPGLLPDRIYLAARLAEPDVLIADPLGADRDLAELVLHRYDHARRRPQPADLRPHHGIIQAR